MASVPDLPSAVGVGLGEYECVSRAGSRQQGWYFFLDALRECAPGVLNDLATSVYPDYLTAWDALQIAKEEATSGDECDHIVVAWIGSLLHWRLLEHWYARGHFDPAASPPLTLPPALEQLREGVYWWAEKWGIGVHPAHAHGYALLRFWTGFCRNRYRESMLLAPDEADHHWLVHYQVQGWSYHRIATIAGRDRKTVEEAVKGASALLHLPLRPPGKGGRPKQRTG